MTSTEQIVWAHRVDKDAGGPAGRDAARLRGSPSRLRRHGAIRDPHLQPDHRRQRDLPSPGRDRKRPLRIHRKRSRRPPDLDRARVRAAARNRQALLRRSRRRHLPLLFSGAGARAAGHVHPRRRLPQPRLRRLRGGRIRRRIDHARIRLGDGRDLLHAREAAARHFPRKASAVGERKGHRAGAPAAVGREAVVRDVRRVRRRREAASHRLPQHDRQHDGRSGGVERDLRAGRDHRRVVPGQGTRAAVSPASRRAAMRSTRSTKRSSSPRSRR